MEGLDMLPELRERQCRICKHCRPESGMLWCVPIVNPEDDRFWVRVSGNDTCDAFKRDWRSIMRGARVIIGIALVSLALAIFVGWLTSSEFIGFCTYLLVGMLATGLLLILNS